MWLSILKNFMINKYFFNKGFTNVVSINKSYKNLIYLSFIILAVYFIAPVNWEPGGESLKNWSAARIFRQTLGFPVLNMTPLFNLYLQFFLFFDYPFSIQFEHFITHIFTYSCLFFLLKKYLPTVPAFFFLLCWIPWIYTIEADSRILAVGFFSLYLALNNHKKFNRGYFPTFLFLAALCDNAYLLVLLLHIVFLFFYKFLNNELSYNKNFFIKKRINEFFYEYLCLLLFFIILILTFLYQSDRLDHNVYAINYPWAPFPIKNILTENIFHCNNFTYAKLNYSINEMYKSDWYFTHEKAFLGAQNLFDGFINNPKLMINHFINNAKSLVKLLPKSFLIGFGYFNNSAYFLFNNIITIFAWI
ncbi:hypothetical protein N8X83_00385, partial [Alphaproteobacteria bacterium]|nr:hypothetical protein [Alphaproteobacteria bacterium]